jgi:hypothetical protein
VRQLLWGDAKPLIDAGMADLGKHA